MEDVPFFITRKLCPPPEVDIPEDLLDAFRVDNDNTKKAESLSYDFTLEKYVCAKISEWVRNTEIDRNNRNERIRVKEIERARQIEAKHKQLLTDVHYDDLSSGEEDGGEEEPQKQQHHDKMFSPSHINFDTILQPTIVPSKTNHTSPTISSSKLLNYSDFETMESSPFDNVELKTINDLDILAQVLQSTTLHSATSDAASQEINNTNDTTKGDTRTAVSPPVFPPYFSSHHNGTNQTVPDLQQQHIIPDILKGLNNEILQSETRRSQSNEREPVRKPFAHKIDINSKNEEKPKQSSLEQQLSRLSPESQSLVNRICQMGFQMERVINVVDKLGEKEKEIVDHLIPLSELLDLGFEEQNVSDALLKFDNNKEKALDFLIS